MKNRLTLFLLLFLTLTLSSCFHSTANSGQKDSASKKDSAHYSKVFTKEEVLDVARKDAQKAYSDLSIYKVIITQKDGLWHVDYELKDSTLNGGGPHYIIAPTGEILASTYEQ